MVRKLTMLLLVDMQLGLMQRFLKWSQIAWYLMSMCLVCLWDSRFWIMLMATWLFVCNIVDAVCGYPRSSINCRIQSTMFVARCKATYSILVVKLVVQPYLQLPHWPIIEGDDKARLRFSVIEVDSKVCITVHPKVFGQLVAL